MPPRSGGPLPTSRTLLIERCGRAGGKPANGADPLTEAVSSEHDATRSESRGWLWPMGVRRGLGIEAP